MHMKCPHCHSPAAIRTSRELSALLREGYYQCSNVVCGHTFKVLVEVVKTLSPASHPDPVIAAQLQGGGGGDSRAQQSGARPAPATRHYFAQLEHSARCEQARAQLAVPAPRTDPPQR